MPSRRVLSHESEHMLEADGGVLREPGRKLHALLPRWHPCAQRIAANNRNHRRAEGTQRAYCVPRLIYSAGHLPWRHTSMHFEHDSS